MNLIHRPPVSSRFRPSSLSTVLCFAAIPGAVFLITGCGFLGMFAPAGVAAQEPPPAGAGVRAPPQAAAAPQAAAEQTSPPNPADDPRANRRLPQRQGDITFDNLKFEIEKGGKFRREMLTEAIEALDNKTLTLRGFILPASVMQLQNIKKFVLVRDNQECCFGPGAAIYDCVIVEMKGDARAEFTTRPVAVTGRFRIKEFKYPDEEDSHYAIYEIQATAVK